jgi:hypothetical protein
MDRRRILLTLLAGTLGVPVGVHAQQAVKAWRIGSLSAGWASSIEEAAFREGLRRHGYTEGHNVLMEWRYAEKRIERLPALATELIRLKVDILVAWPTAAIRAAASATKTMPIVMAFSADPVGSGLVASLARPGANVTGLATIAVEVTPKRLEFLRTVIPTVTKISFLASQATPRRVLTETEVSPLLHEHRTRIADLALKMRLASSRPSACASYSTASDFQNIVARGISDQLLKWKAIEVAHELSKSPNAKIIGLGDKSGLPIILSEK